MSCAQAVKKKQSCLSTHTVGEILSGLKSNVCKQSAEKTSCIVVGFSAACVILSQLVNRARSLLVCCNIGRCFKPGVKMVFATTSESRGAHL